jgi:hypothetical protein
MMKSIALREAFRLGIAVALLGCCHAAQSAAQSADAMKVAAAPAKGPGSLSGIWQTQGEWRTAAQAQTDAAQLGSLRTPERTRVVKTIDGSWAPLQPWASEILEKRITQSQQGNPEPISTTQCLPGVPVMMLGGPYPVQILEAPGQVTILFEEQNHFRIIYLNRGHPEDPDPTFMGHSVGRWEGDTLVVDTIALTDRTSLDRVGMPHSDQLHLVERFRRGTGNTLEVITTIDDPKAFTKKWDMKVVFSTAQDLEMTEYICENNRDLPE